MTDWSTCAQYHLLQHASALCLAHAADSFTYPALVAVSPPGRGRAHRSWHAILPAPAHHHRVAPRTATPRGHAVATALVHPGAGTSALPVVEAPRVPPRVVPRALEALLADDARQPVVLRIDTGRAELEQTIVECGVRGVLAQQLAHASQVVREQSLAQASYLREILGSLPDSESRERHRRFEEAIDVASGTATVHYAHPIQLHYPRLPAIPFFERHHFPWIEELERSTPKIKDELEALQLSSNTDWAPYVRYQPGTPENQFKELNNNSDWSSIWLWRDGAQQRAADLCPETMDVLKNVPLADQPGFAPTALFSALAPLKRIPPHTGSTNTRALVHLPLVVPGPAFFRVGNETRQWHTGAAWVFDDTIQHEAWNDAGETRIILIFDVWNPFLSEGEKDKIRTLLTAKKNWLAEEASH